MTPERIEALKALAESATPGPWEFGGTKIETLDDAVEICRKNIEATSVPHDFFMEVFLDDGRRTALVGNGPTSIQNAAYIAAANPAAVLSLIASATASEARIAEFDQRIADLQNTLADMVQWLEANQVDVFKRGIWGAIGNNAAALAGSAAPSRPEVIPPHEECERPMIAQRFRLLCEKMAVSTCGFGDEELYSVIFTLLGTMRARVEEMNAIAAGWNAQSAPQDTLKNADSGAAGLPPELSKAFMTLESSGSEGRTIVLKFNQREDAYAVHEFLLKGGA